MRITSKKLKPATRMRRIKATHVLPVDWKGKDRYMYDSYLQAKADQAAIESRKKRMARP